ncbi:hypothetical protein FB451DRAFT_599591 [Mycena latifolia]|nr:hypothetical protein FB451DRAFT_599591 [Mycena latifolia]
MEMEIPLGKAQFLSLFLETFVYGIAFNLCAITVIVLVRFRSKTARIEGCLVFLAILMQSVATVHLILSFNQALAAFVLGTNGTPEDYYRNVGASLFIAKDAFFIFQTMLGDGVNIWRCYVVYGRRVKFIVIPLIIATSGVVFGCLTLESDARAKPGTPIFEFTRWITGLGVAMMATNVYCTAMTSWRVFQTTKNTRRNLETASSSSMMPIVFIIVESGALYTSSLFAFLVAFLSKSNGQFPALDLITPLVPCIFCLILLQIKFHSTRSHPSSQASAVSTPHHLQLSSNGRTDRDAYPMRPLVISVTTQAVERRDAETGNINEDLGMSKIPHSDLESDDYGIRGAKA